MGINIFRNTQMVKQTKAGAKAKKPTHKFVIKCTDPVEDNVLVLSDFEQYLTQRIKVDGKINNLGQSVTIAKDKDALIVETKIVFSKRYLKQQEPRQYLRVIATGKNGYELKFPHVNQ